MKGFGSQSREQSTKEELTNLLKFKTSVLPTPRLRLVCLSSKRRDSGGPNVACVEVLESVLTSSNWASSKMPARSLQRKGRLGHTWSIMGGEN